MLNVSPSPILNKFAEELKEAGYLIINSYTYKNSDPSLQKYFHFYKDGYFGFAEETCKGVYSIGAEYQHSLEFGKGTQARRGSIDQCLTLEHAEKSIDLAKHIIEVEGVAKNWEMDEFLQSNLHPRILI